jgi:hypothetical protein
VRVEWYVNLGPLLLFAIAIPVGLIMISVDGLKTGNLVHLIPLIVAVGVARLALIDRRGPALPPYWPALWLQRALFAALVGSGVFAVSEGPLRPGRSQLDYLLGSIAGAAIQVKSQFTNDQIAWVLTIVQGLVLLGLGIPAVRATRRCFQNVPSTRRVAQRRWGVRMRAIMLVLFVLFVHHLVLVRIFPRFPIHLLEATLKLAPLPISHPVVLVGAVTLAAVGYVILAQRLWNATRTVVVAGGEVSVGSQTAALGTLLSPALGSIPAQVAPAPAQPTLPRHPKTGRVQRQFDV